MRSWVVVAAVGLSGCAHHFECEKHGGAPVVRIDSQHFSVTSDLPAKDARFEVQRLERLWAVFAAFFQHAPQTGERLRVVLSHDEASKEYVPNSAGFVTRGLSPLMVTTVLEEGSTNAHELTHVMSLHWLPRQPRWIAEGLAEFLGDASFKSDYSLRFGRWHWRGGEVEPLETLWSWEARGDLEEEWAHYQSAWAWIHYLANKEPERVAKLWTAMAGAQPPRDAFESIFPSSETRALHQKVQAYVDRAIFNGRFSTLMRDPVVSEPVAVSDWEVHLLRRDVALQTRWIVRAKAESARARELAPKPEPYQVTLAVALDTLEGPELSDALLALRDEPEVLLQRGFAVDTDPWVQLTSLQRAAAALPDSPVAQLAIARVSLRLGDTGALPAAQRAVSLAPWSVEARVLEAQALAGARRCEEAWRSVAAATGLAVESAKDDAPGVQALRTKLRLSCPEAK